MEDRLSRKLLHTILLLGVCALLGACDNSLLYQQPNSIPTKAPGSSMSIVSIAPEATSAVKQDGNSRLSVTPAATQAPTDTPTPTLSPTPTPSPTPTATPTPIPPVPEAPAALNTDLRTDTFLINREYPLSGSYVPEDLVVPNIPFSFTDTTADKRKMRRVAAQALEELYQASITEASLEIFGVSGYRSYDRQYEIYGTNLINKGLRHTNLYSAAPGTSEHQTGMAIDLSCPSIGYDLLNSFADTPEGKWLKENCWRFGFILRYPKDKENITGYAYEPWHIRYVGVPLAYYLYNTGLTLDEYYGTRSQYTLSELATMPLINTATDRFYRLYASVKKSELLILADGSVPVSAVSGYPYLKEPITDASGRRLYSSAGVYYKEPLFDADGKPIISNKDTVYCREPYFDSLGNLWLDKNQKPVFLDPLLNADGSFAKDANGGLRYTEPVKDGLNKEFVTKDGGILPKVPVRDENRELTFYSNGAVVFFEPLLDMQDGFILDMDGLPMFEPEYYEELERLELERLADTSANQQQNPELPDLPGLPSSPGRLPDDTHVPNPGNGSHNSNNSGNTADSGQQGSNSGSTTTGSGSGNGTADGGQQDDTPYSGDGSEEGNGSEYGSPYAPVG